LARDFDVFTERKKREKKKDFDVGRIKAPKDFYQVIPESSLKNKL